MHTAAGTRRTTIAARAAAVVLGSLAAVFYFTSEPAPPVVIRWRAGVPPQQQAEIERRFGLARARGEEQEGVTYDLLDSRPDNVEELLGRPEVEATGYIDEATYTIPADVPDGVGSTWVLERQVFSPELRMFRVVPAVVTICVLVVGYACAASLVRRRRRIRRSLAFIRGSQRPRFQRPNAST